MGTRISKSTMSEEVEFVKLVSSGHVFHCKKEAALVSGAIRSMLSGPAEFAESESGEIQFEEITAPILEKFIQYFYYKHKYANAVHEIPEFVIEPSVALELLMAANFLDA